MYETKIFPDGKTFIEWAQKSIAKSSRAQDMVGWDGGINIVKMDKDLAFLYQLEQRENGWEVVDMHMLLWGAERSPRKDICKISEFFRPDDGVLWHASLIYGGRRSLDFCVANAFYGEPFDKYSKGGNFEMTFAGLGDYLECMNDKGVVRFYNGNPVEMARMEKNDPTIDHADVIFSELRSLNSSSAREEPALAEFTGIVEWCETVMICGVKCYRIRLMSGSHDDTSSFPWCLLIAANRVEGKYMPRVGDSVHGTAYMYGSFHGEKQESPSIYLEQELLEKVDGTVRSEDEPIEDADPEPLVESVAETEKDWEWLPRRPETYPEIKSFGKRLSKSVAKVLPRYIVYNDYRRQIIGELKSLKHPSRKELKRILDSIDYVIKSKNNLRMFGSDIDVIGVRHFVVDTKTNERHLWCAIPSGYGQERFHTNLLVALNEVGDVLRYTLYTGDLQRGRLRNGMHLKTHICAHENVKQVSSMSLLLAIVSEMSKDDFIIAESLGGTSMLQAYCDDVVAGVQQFRIEWQVHYTPWQFYINKATLEQLIAMLQAYDMYGIEAIQTMACWKWCKMKGNT